MIPSIGTPELIIIMALALIVFGPKKLPEIGRSIGQGLRELRKASRDIMETLETDDEPQWKSQSAHSPSSTPLDTVGVDTVGEEEADEPKENTDNVTDSNRTA